MPGVSDAGIIGLNWLRSVAEINAQAVPEPMTVGGLVLVGASLAARCRQRQA